MSDLFSVEYGCVNVKGRIREENQDNFYVDGKYRLGVDKGKDIVLFGELLPEENRLVAAFDGMGGEARGDMAALIAAGGAADFDRMNGNDYDVMVNMCNALNDRVCRYAESSKIMTMGTTVAAIRFSDKGIFIANLGDSRIYGIAGNSIRQLTKDHVSESVSGRKGLLVQYLGLPTDEIQIEPFIDSFNYVAGERLLICSDGITDMLCDSSILSIVNSCTQVKDAVMQLVSAAIQNGGRDNITAILCEIKKR